MTMTHLTLSADTHRCTNGECPLRLSCRRFTDRGMDGLVWQSHFFPDADGTCPHQIKEAAQ